MSDIIITHGRRIVSETYYDGTVTTTQQQIEQSLFTSKKSVLKDIIDALTVISSGESHELELKLQVDGKGRYKLTKRWAV